MLVRTKNKACLVSNVRYRARLLRGGSFIEKKKSRKNGLLKGVIFLIENLQKKAFSDIIMLYLRLQEIYGYFRQKSRAKRMGKNLTEDQGLCFVVDYEKEEKKGGRREKDQTTGDRGCAQKQIQERAQRKGKYAG